MSPKYWRSSFVYLRGNHRLYSNDIVNIFKISGGKVMIVKVVQFWIVYFFLPESLGHLRWCFSFVKTSAFRPHISSFSLYSRVHGRIFQFRRGNSCFWPRWGGWVSKVITEEPRNSVQHNNWKPCITHFVGIFRIIKFAVLNNCTWKTPEKWKIIGWLNSLQNFNQNFFNQ